MNYKINRLVFCLLLIGITNVSAQNVDKFTGDFSYSIPLLTVPSPDGGGVPVSVNYQAGIGVDQPASEIGLGWGLSAGGMVSRSVSGVPDDWDGVSIASVHEAGYYDQSQQLHTYGFISHNGVLSFKGGGFGISDIYQSFWKIDTPSFYFPDYDAYFAAAPGLFGILEPHMFEYAEIEKSQLLNSITYKTNASSDPEDFSKKAQFVFIGDYADTLYSRYYPEPIDQYTTPIYPDEQAFFNGNWSYLDFAGEDHKGYNTESYTEVANKNRLVTSRYIEYFTNDEIDNGISGFINYESGHARSSSTYPAEGIGAFRITNESGVTYHFSLPVYIDSTKFGDYPLHNDYSIENYYDHTEKTTHNNGYILKDYDLDEHVIEYKQDAKYAYEWLLTAITGPKYVDSNSDGMVNEGDLGYWVSFNYQKWSDAFTSRGPFYGYTDVFSAVDGDETENYPIDASGKISGRTGAFNTTTQELYYLNSIQTASHTAIFIRDIRKDEHSVPKYYDEEPNALITASSVGSQSTDAWFGTLYDDGGPEDPYTATVEYSLEISPKGAEKVEIEFPFLDLGSVLGNYDSVKVYNVSVAEANLIDFASPAHDPEEPILSTGQTVVVRFTTDGTTPAPGFELKWKAVWDDTIPKVMPQLKLDKIVLLKNEDLAGLPSLDTIVPSSIAWDMGLTTNTSANFYSLNWYNDNYASIEAASLKTVDFETDYSLARKYHNNINVFSATAKTDNQTNVKANLSVAANKYDESGKLTLNEIKIYDIGHTQITPSYLFDYNKDFLLDNPDYDSKAVDNWGYYKKDVTTDGYSNYTTLQSKNYVDAWCLRKITSPLGGTIHIEYESDEYEKVFSENDGFKGASRTYLIEDASTIEDIAGEDWNFVMEDYVSDFVDLVNNAPAGTEFRSFLPSYFDSEIYFYNTGNTTFDLNNGVITFDTLYGSSPDASDYELDDVDDVNDWEEENFHYTGNGYFNFKLPIGHKVYGGGVRVKRITINNCTDDTYRQEYLYTEGVTPSEPDRFALTEKVKQYGYSDSPFDWINIKAKSLVYDKHIMGPGVGYSSVTVKNVGQTNAPLGTTTYSFITDPTGIDNFQPTVVMEDHAPTDGGCEEATDKDTTYIIDVSDKFSAFWGLPSSVVTKDVNDNIVSSSKSIYSSLRQGVIVENYDFLNKYCPGCDFVCPECGPIDPCYFHKDVICILRSYPARLTQQIMFERGVSDTTDYLLFDDVTWAPIEVENRNFSQDITHQRIIPSYRIADYEETGPKSIDQDYTNQLGSTFSSTTTLNSDIIDTEDFSSSTISTLREDYTLRAFSTSNYQYENTAITGSYWVSGPSYSWTGPVGDYGLYDEASFVEFNPSSINSNWKYLGETTIYDQKRRSLEKKTSADRYSATKFGYDDKYPIASGANVNYESFTHTSFEDYFTAYSGYDYYGGEVEHQGETVRDNSYSTIVAHTGNYYISVPSSTEGPVFIAKKNSSNDENLMVGRVYRASVWVHEDSPNDSKLHTKLTKNSSVIADVSVSRNSSGSIVSGKWILISLDIEVPDDYEYQAAGDDFRVYVEGGSSGTAYFDDLRVQPVDANINAVIYDDITGRVIFTLDNNNFGIYRVYDEAGNVIQVFEEKEGHGFKKKSEVVYEYAR